MRLVSMLSVLAFALALGGCGKKEEQKKAEEPKKVAEEQLKKAEEAKKAAEALAAEEAKKVEEAAKAAEEAKKAAEALAAEEAKKAEEAAKAAEEAKKAEEAKAAEEAKKAEEAKAEDPAAKAAEELQQRRERIQEIYKLGRSTNPEDIAKLEELIKGDAQPYEKATALRALSSNKVETLIPTLKTLAEDKDLAVKSEAAILLYQWGEKEFSKPLMEQLLDQGVAMRRAFFKGIQDGKYTYEPEAEEFFTKAMGAKQVHVKLDAALGMMHLGKNDVAVAAFKEALADQDKEYVRLTAVSYLASAREIPEAKALLEQAANDPSPKVANRAKQILGILAPEGTPAPAPAGDSAAPAPAAGGGAAAPAAEPAPAP
ncbi:MAG: HEAT repeat domain-containing protein [Deltaproteobacteria bacterium]|nr:HEAT repeat domain-containing protein [Deltaproteobacteria bacterium]